MRTPLYGASAMLFFCALWSGWWEHLVRRSSFFAQLTPAREAAKPATTIGNVHLRESQMPDWYVRNGEREHGPYSPSQLKSLAVNNKIARDCQIRRADRSEWMQAGTVKGLFTSGKPKDTGLPEVEIRRRLTAYADKIPNHDLTELGDQVNIEKVSTLPIFWVRLATLYDIRSLSQVTRAYRDDNLAPRTFYGDEEIVWKLQLPKLPGFQNHQDWHPVPGSDALAQCPTCAGNGAADCHDCSGSGNVYCGVCGGSGLQDCGGCGGTGMSGIPMSDQRVRKCWSCGGTGHERFKQHVVCDRCNGRGLEHYTHRSLTPIPCPACGTTGQITCRQCHGHGYHGCATCSANGVLPCDDCEGSGRAIVGYVVNRRTQICTDEGMFNPEGIPVSLREGLPEPDFEIIHEQEGLFQSLSDIRPSLSMFKAEIKAKLKASAARTGDHQRIVWHKLAVLKSAVTHVEYRHEGKTYEAWLPGKGDTVVAVTSPVTEQVDGLVEESLNLWNSGQKHTGALAFRHVLEMALKDNGCKLAFQKSMVKRKGTISADLLHRAPVERPVWEQVFLALTVAIALVGICGSFSSEIGPVFMFFAIAGSMGAIALYLLRTKPLDMSAFANSDGDVAGSSANTRKNADSHDGEPLVEARLVEGQPMLKLKPETERKTL